MELRFSDKVNSFQPGIFAALNEKKEELLKQGRKVYNLSVGTPDFAPAPHVMEAMAKACQKPENYRYSLTELPELIDAVRFRYRHRFGVELKNDEIMSVYGSQEGLAHIGMVFCNPGDTVLIPDPGYPIFEMCGVMAGANLVTYSLDETNGYLPRFEEIPDQILKEAKFMIVSYPLNPVCACAPDDFYRKLIRFAKKHEIVILHDNAYSDIIYTEKQGKSFLAFEGAKEVGVEFYSLSKSYNLTGARISFVVGNAEIIRKFKVFRSQIDYGIFLPVQYAAIAALTGPDDFIEKQREKYESRNRTLCGGLRALGWYIPDSQGTMFAWGPIPEKYPDSLGFCLELMEKTGVIVTPGNAFGKNGEGYVRFALVIDEAEIQEMLEVLRQSGMFE